MVVCMRSQQDATDLYPGRLGLGQAALLDAGFQCFCIFICAASAQLWGQMILEFR